MGNPNPNMRATTPTPAGHQSGHPNQAAKGKCHHMIQAKGIPCESPATHRQRGSGIPLCSSHAKWLASKGATIIPL